MRINWHDIRSFDGSQRDGFEELTCQLARKEKILNTKKFIRKGKPDAGVECFWILENGDEWAWQAKYFTASISNTQWGELDSSIETALDKHPNLKKYYISIPNDPPDARVDNQESMLEKWDKHVDKWCDWAQARGMKIDIIPWWSSDLIQRLQKSENAGLTYFWFNKDEFTNKWFKDQTQEAIADLGKRYTPEINVELDISETLDGLSRNKNVSETIYNLFDNLIVKSRIVFDNNKILSECNIELERISIKLREIFLSLEISGVSYIPIDEIIENVNKLSDIVEEINDGYLLEEDKLLEENKDYRYYSKYGYEINRVSELSNSITDLLSFLLSNSAKLINNPYLILEGKAGVGKSHLLADTITKRNNDNSFSLLFLGQHFVSDIDPWTQIFMKNKIKCSVDEFLGSLNSKAQVNGNRLILFFDAVNEGRGLFFWKNNIKSFLHKLKEYEWIGVVFSVRSSYTELIFPKEELTDEHIMRTTHYGFSFQEYNATRLFFNYYGIELPSIPKLHPEFQNPLFLKIFCEGLNKKGITRIPDGLYGISEVFDNYIDSINFALSNPSRLNYSTSLNLVQKAIDIYINYLFDNSVKYMTFDDAAKIINSISLEYNLNIDLLTGLISEGLFSKNVFHLGESKYEEGIYLSYERFEDHLFAQHLLNCCSSKKEIKNIFSSDGRYFYINKDKQTCSMNKGLLEALAIQLPEKFNLELFEVVENVAEEYQIVECFLQSLLWRKLDTMSEHLLEYVNKVVFKNRRTSDLFWITIISVATVPNHYFNAFFLHKNLLNRSLADRDMSWTTKLKYEYWSEFNSAINRLVEWCKDNSNSKHISDESVELVAITVSWFLTSTNRELRDNATKALVSLCVNRIDVFIIVFERFINVNDPYILERLFAVAYGCALRTNDKDKLPSLSSFIYEEIFNTEGEVTPNILLRDYARGVIEYTIQLGYSLNTEIEKIRPPYKSDWPKSLPTEEEIEQLYEVDYKNENFKDYYWSQDYILSSMTTEYGKGMYGDFGRYTFEAALRDWDVDTIGLSNLAISWIFGKYGYDVEKHGEFDRVIGHERGRNTYSNERIGKKYQWIAMHEILARVADNCKLYSNSYSKKQRILYKGTWELYIRDIDPTYILTSKNAERMKPNGIWYKKQRYKNWYISDEKWIYLKEDLPKCKDIICMNDDNNNEWIMLQGYPEWRESKPLGKEEYKVPYKRLWYQLRSYVVSEKDFDELFKWGRDKNFMGRWMPENHDSYTVFYREYYWSQAYDECYYNKEIYPQYIYEKDDKICRTEVTVNNYVWEKTNDYSIDDTIQILLPSKDIFNNLRLKFSDENGILLDEDGKVICFNTQEQLDNMYSIIIKKEPLLRSLKQRKKKIIWTLLGEKQVISGFSSNNKLRKRLSINGMYYFNENGDLTGDMKPIEE